MSYENVCQTVKDIRRKRTFARVELIQHNKTNNKTNNKTSYKQHYLHHNHPHNDLSAVIKKRINNNDIKRGTNKHLYIII